MQNNTRTIALIDGANLHRNVSELGWKLDYRKFRTFLAECYGVECALVFLGYLPENRRLYQDLRRWGYSPIFRQTCRGFDGSVKGNCDGNLAVWAVASFFEQRYSSAVLVSGDGDFAALASFLVLHTVLFQRTLCNRGHVCRRVGPGSRPMAS